MRIFSNRQRTAFTALAIALCFAAPAAAQDQPAAAEVTADYAEQPDAARMAAADALVSMIVPTGGEEAERWAESFALPAFDNATAGMMDRPEIKTALRQFPRMRQITEGFIGQMRAIAVQSITSDFAAFRTAMSTAYARRFTVDQLTTITAFLSTDTGRVYNDRASGILSDDGVTAWQRAVAERTRTAMQPLVERYMEQVAELVTKAETNGGE